MDDESGAFSTYLFAADVQAAIRSHQSNFPSKPAFFYLPLQNVHAPLESPGGRYDSVCKGVPNDYRRTFCAMAAIADDAIGNVSASLASAFEGEEYLVVVSGDNGGIPTAAGNNYPLRGHKAELWEGGVRNNAIVYGSFVPKAARGTTYSAGFIHVTDWHATFAALAGATLAGHVLDGHNVWPAITTGAPSPRTELLHNYDPCTPAFGEGCEGVEWAYRLGDMKLLQGVVAEQVYPVPTSAGPVTIRGLHHESVGAVWWDAGHYSDTDVYLFNVTADPSESNNLIDSYPQLVKTIRAKVDAIVNGSDYLPPCNIPDGACYGDDATAQAVLDAHGGWYPWL